LTIFGGIDDLGNLRDRLHSYDEIDDLSLRWRQLPQVWRIALRPFSIGRTFRIVRWNRDGLIQCLHPIATPNGAELDLAAHRTHS
jgi:hypothetical protein